MAYRAGRRQADLDAYEQQASAAAQYPSGQGAGAPPPAPAPAPAPTSEADRVRALSDLKDLLDEGAISQAEYDAEKRKLLGA